MQVFYMKIGQFLDYSYYAIYRPIGCFQETNFSNRNELLFRNRLKIKEHEIWIIFWINDDEKSEAQLFKDNDLANLFNVFSPIGDYGGPKNRNMGSFFG